MALGFERLNERTQRPNPNINFIRTRPGPTSSTAEQILNRVAAICYPFMKSASIYVQALEEFPFNTEFVGRNFNAGEVIQLVLRDRQGRWLPQKTVEMVMVHELAHCKQMNHSASFWNVRNAYAEELKKLWVRGYTGDGMWGRGRELKNGVVQMQVGDSMDIPENLCGGTYSRRGKKRRRGGDKGKETLSYAERKQRRILKRFGAGGQALGDDQETKVKLEGGVSKKGKPRVAGSARGRELRAAAALARLDTTSKAPPEIKAEVISSDSDTDYDDDDLIGTEAAIDVDGKKMTDDKGRALVKICEEEDPADENVKREMNDLQGLTQLPPELDPSNPRAAKTKASLPTIDTSNSLGTSDSSKPLRTKRSPISNNTTPSASKPQVIYIDEIYKRRPDLSQRPPSPARPPVSSSATCTLCSLHNEPGSITCMACANVLNPHLDARHWRCKSASCKGSNYINAGDAGDAGRCGVCGALK